MFFQLLLLTLILVGISLAGLGIRLLLQPHSRFPETHIGRNREMQRRGITCVKDAETGCHPGDNNDCSGCRMQ
jgi:hypothetical protein